MNPKQFCELLKNQGFNLFVGVPCSILTEVLYYFMGDSEVMYVPATREDEAIGIAVGAYFGGRKSTVFMQNSGLGLSVNALASLVLLYRVPVLFLITWRGDTNLDAPEHLLMGKFTLKLLEAMEIPTYILEEKNIEETVLEAQDVMEKSSGPVVLLLREGIVK
jgi:phosphonopyruvate decarboxylase